MSESHPTSRDEALESVLRHALAYVNHAYKTSLKLKTFSDGEAYIINKEYEVVRICGGKRSGMMLYASDIYALIQMMLDPCVKLQFYIWKKSQPIERMICFSDIFGTSIDEMKVKLDLISELSEQAPNHLI